MASYIGSSGHRDGANFELLNILARISNAVKLSYDALVPYRDFVQISVFSQIL